MTDKWIVEVSPTEEKVESVKESLCRRNRRSWTEDDSKFVNQKSRWIQAYT